MGKTAVNFINKRYTISPNTMLRKKIYDYRKGICFSCYAKKKLTGSLILFSNKCKSHWDIKNARWYTDMNDYIWLCKNCASRVDADNRITITAEDWAEAKYTSYQFT